MRPDHPTPALETEWPTVPGTGTAKAGPALSWAWRATLSNWELWVPFAATGLVVMVLNFRLFLPLTPLVIAALVIPFSSTTALRQTRERRFGVWDIRVTAYREVLLTALLAVAVCTGVFVAVSTLITVGVDDLFAARTFGQGAPFHQTSLFWMLTGIVVLLNLMAPLLNMVLFYSADGRSMWEAVVPGVLTGLRNYRALLGIAAAATALNAVGLACLGIGLCLTLPTTLLAFAHAYVQVVGEQVPTGRR